MAEIIEIGLNDNKPKNLTVSDNNEKGTIKLSGLPPASPSLKKSVNFGPGADLLMNPSRKIQDCLLKIEAEFIISSVLPFSSGSKT